jgi:hypothetical protein
MTLGRVAAAAVYFAAAILWVGGMWLGSMLGCEYGCFGDERDRLDTSLVLSLVGVALAAAAFFGSVFSRRLGLLLLGVHLLVFAINLAVLSEVGDAEPWILVLPAALAAVAGYFAVGGRQLTRPRDHGP